MISEGEVCVKCGTVGDLDMVYAPSMRIHGDGDCPKIFDNHISNNNGVVIEGSTKLSRCQTVCNQGTTLSKSLKRDYELIGCIVSIDNHFCDEDNEIVKLTKELAFRVKTKVWHESLQAVSDRVKSKSFRGCQRDAILMACFILACGKHGREINFEKSIEMLSKMPSFPFKQDRQVLTKYYHEASKQIENVLYDANSSTNDVTTRKKDTTCISQYISSICMGLDKRVKYKLLKYSKRLLQAINDVDIKGACFIQSHNSENIAGAIVLRCSNITTEFDISVDALISIGQARTFQFKRNTLFKICGEIDDLFRIQVEYKADDIETLLGGELPVNGDQEEKAFLPICIGEIVGENFCEIVKYYQ
jgi:hypothetical protein